MWRGGRVAGLRQEGGAEGFFEIKGSGKIFFAIGFLAAENLLLDQMKDHVANVTALAYAPLQHQGGGHGPELFQGKIAEADEEFRPADVARLAVVGLGNTFEGEIQCLPEKKIGLGIDALVAVEDGDDGLLEVHGLHGGTMRVGSGSVKAV